MLQRHSRSVATLAAVCVVAQVFLTLTADAHSRQLLQGESSSELLTLRLQGLLRVQQQDLQTALSYLSWASSLGLLCGQRAEHSGMWPI